MPEPELYACVSGVGSFLGGVTIVVYQLPKEAACDWQLIRLCSDYDYKENNWEKTGAILEALKELGVFIHLHTVSTYELNNGLESKVINKAFEFVLASVFGRGIKGSKVICFSKLLGSIYFPVEYRKNDNSIECVIGRVISESRRRRSLCQVSSLYQRVAFTSHWGEGCPELYREVLLGRVDLSIYRLERVRQLPFIWYRNLVASKGGMVHEVYLRRWDLILKNTWSSLFECSVKEQMGSKWAKAIEIVSCIERGVNEVQIVKHKSAPFTYRKSSSISSKRLERKTLMTNFSIERGRRLTIVADIVNNQPKELSLEEAFARADKLSCIASKAILKGDIGSDYVNGFLLQTAVWLSLLKREAPEAYERLRQYESHWAGVSLLESIIITSLCAYIPVETTQAGFKDIVLSHIEKDRPKIRAAICEKDE